MCPTTCRRPPMSRWSTSGWSSISFFPSSRFLSTHTWTPSGKFFSRRIKISFWNRDDEDREINHHGRPVEVGEAESSPANGVIKVNLTSSYNRCLVKRYFIVFPSLPRFLRKIWLLWTRRFSWGRWQVSTAGGKLELEKDFATSLQGQIKFQKKFGWWGIPFPSI